MQCECKKMKSWKDTEKKKRVRNDLKTFKSKNLNKNNL